MHRTNGNSSIIKPSRKYHLVNYKIQTLNIKVVTKASYNIVFLPSILFKVYSCIPLSMEANPSSSSTQNPVPLPLALFITFCFIFLTPLCETNLC